MSETTALEVKENPTAAVPSPDDIDMEEEQAIKIKKAKELYANGSRNFLVGAYVDAADELSQVCSIYEEVYGSLSDELGVPYLLYAKILLAIALEDNKVVDVPEEQQDEEVDEEGEEDEGEAENTDNTDNKEDVKEKDEQEEKLPKDAENKKTEKMVNGHEKMEINGDIETEEIEEEKTASVEKKESQVTDGSDKSPKKDEKKTVKTSETKKSEEMEESSKDDKEDEEDTNSDSNGVDESKEKMEKIAEEEEDDVKPSTSNGIKSQEDEVDEDGEPASNLQLAWEILELAGKIFERQGDDGLSNLAQVHTELGNIQLENSIFNAARDDYEKAVKIYENQKESSNRRLRAEMYYKIGLTQLMEDMNTESVASFNQSCKLLDEEIDELKSKPELSEKDQASIKEMEESKQEVILKIAEMQESHAQVAEVRAALDSYIKPQSDVKKLEAPITPEECCANKKANDITHLIKRKKSDVPPTETSPGVVTSPPAKRPAV